MYTEVAIDRVKFKHILKFYQVPGMNLLNKMMLSICQKVKLYIATKGTDCFHLVVTQCRYVI